ncbi:galactosylceramide sulfotransferase-like [Antedon mediterranea]|uniref:galactosylceramide sulfotransferase-like n=1 Tax=Antedon mediterranea TaxID=105859 RepID=UPI003AF8A98D
MPRMCKMKSLFFVILMLVTLTGIYNIRKILLNQKCPNYRYCVDLNSSWRKHISWSEPKQANSTLSEIACNPYQHIVLLKTHKTGSTTLSLILHRYGFLRNLTFASPKRGHIISHTHFNRKQVLPGTYDLLVNHVRYNRTEMEAVMKPDTKYITIIRDPSTQLESVFGYFQLFNPLHLQNEQNPYRTFMSKPQYFLDRYPEFRQRSYLRNPLLYDFGLDHVQQLNQTLLNETIRKIETEFDLIMLQEYFNESLLLLKKLFCWEWDDILYITKTVRIASLRYNVSDKIREDARKWCASDAQLYDHFKVIFLEKLKNYGPELEKDLKFLEFKLNQTMYECTLPDKTPNIKDRSYRPIANLKHNNTLCPYMMNSAKEFASIVRNKQNVKSSVVKKRKKTGRRRKKLHNSKYL